MTQQVEATLEQDTGLDPNLDFDQLSVSPASKRSTNDAHIDGIELSEYAAAHDLDENSVWDLIREGKLAARTEKGMVFLYDRALSDIELAVVASAEPQLEATPMPKASLPPLPSTYEIRSSTALMPQGSTAPEIALLLDHLSLAKEEHREIIRLTQDSIQRISLMSEQLLSVKDTMIKEREEKIQVMEKQVAERDQNLSKLRQELEDMEILTRTLSSEREAPRDRS